MTPDERAALRRWHTKRCDCYPCDVLRLLDALDAETGARALDNAQHREAYSLMHRSFTAAAAERDEARAGVDHVRALLNAKRAWIDGAKVDLDGYDEARAALDRVRALCDPREERYVGFGVASAIRAAIDGGAS